MLYVYCPQSSTAALGFVQALGATRLRRFDGLDFWGKAKRMSPEAGSTIVCWGATLPEIDDIRILNSLDVPLNKYQQYQKLTAARIPTPRLTLYDGGHSVQVYIDAGYSPRLFNGGDPLKIKGTDRADYFVQNSEFLKEYRVHSFAGRSIRAGLKVVRDGFKLCGEKAWQPDSNLAHAWIKSYEGGWRVNYDGFVSTPAMRDIAHKAVKTLGLTFGIVDIGMTSGGSLSVIDIHTACKIDVATLNAYIKAIQRWIKKEDVTEGE